MNLKIEPSAEPLDISAKELSLNRNDRRMPVPCVGIVIDFGESQSLGTKKNGASSRLDGGDMKRFQGGLVFKPRRLLYHSTRGARVIKKKNKLGGGRRASNIAGLSTYRGTSLIRNSPPPRTAI